MTQVSPLILLVEDEVLIALDLEEALQDAGFEVLSFALSGKALEIIERQETAYCALVTDIDLGGDVNGWHLGHRARELEPDLPVIYMSGKSAVEWKAHGVPDSIMLQKPFVFAQLLTALSNLLNKQEPKLDT
jgi:DNA-binding response OmpR family regulator